MAEHTENIEFQDVPEILTDIHRACIVDFMFNLFGYAPDDFSVSDESLLSDFVDIFEPDEEYNQAINKLNTLYGTSFNSNESYYIYEVAMEIKKLKK